MEENNNFTEKTLTMLSIFESTYNQFYDFYKTPNNKKYINTVIGYGFFICLYLGFVDFTFFNVLYLIGLTYLNAMQYYKQLLQENDAEKDDYDNRSLIAGWVLYTSLIFFDFGIRYIENFFGVITRFVRIVMYILYSKQFINFFESRIKLLDEAIEYIKSNKDEYPIKDNVFKTTFINILFVNNKILTNVCLIYNITVLKYIILSIDELIVQSSDLVNLVQEHGLVNGMKLKMNKNYDNYFDKQYEQNDDQNDDHNNEQNIKSSLLNKINPVYIVNIISTLYSNTKTYMMSLLYSNNSNTIKIKKIE